MNLVLRSRAPYPWRPFLEGQARDVAHQSVQDVAQRLTREVVNSDLRSDVSIGTSGLALTLAYLSACLNRDDLLETARAAWNSAVDDLARHNSHVGLHGGFCGPAWVAAHVGGLLVGDDEDEVHEEIEYALEQHLDVEKWDRDYDLIRGLVGFGVYALERWPRGRSPALIDRVVWHLARLA